MRYFMKFEFYNINNRSKIKEMIGKHFEDKSKSRG